MSLLGKETYIVEQKYTVDNDNLIKGNNAAKTSTTGLSSSVGSLTGNLKGMISPTNIVAGAMAFMAYKTVQAVKDFAAYEKQMSSVNTLLKVSRKELAEYGNGLIDVAIKTGTTKEELASGAYEALSAGVDATDLLSFMETAAKGAAAGMTDVTTATDVLTSTINGFKLESSDATDVMDKLITIQNNGKIVLGEMSTVMGDVADISNNLGVDLNNVGAALSTITMSGTPAAQAGTRIKAMFSELAKEGTDASGVFEEITGQSFKEFIAEGGNVGEALQEMEKYAKSNGKQMIDLWSSIEAGQGAMGLTGENAEAFTKNLDSMKKSAGELETAFQLASATISTEWTKLTGTMNKKWMELVLKMRDPIIVTLQVIRRGLGGETDDDLRSDATKSLSEAESKIAKLAQQEDELQKQIKENEKNPTWWAEKGWGGTESLKVKLANIQETLKKATWEYEKANNDIAALDAKNADTVTDGDSGNDKGSDSGGGGNSGGDNNGNEPDKEKKRLEKIAVYEAEHADTIKQIDIGVLEKKRAFYEDLNTQLESGQISKEEYDKLATAYDRNSQTEQDEQYIEALEKLKAFYSSIGEVAKANEIEKQILEIEVETNIHVGENYEEDTALKEFLDSQLEAEKEFKSQLAELEANFQYEMLTLKSQGDITDSEFAQKEKDHQNNLLTMTQQHDIDMLEEKRDFYALQKQDMTTALEIEAEIIEKKKELKDAEKKNDKEELTWRQTYEDFKQDITGMAETATKSAYRDAIENEENFGTALKSALQDQLKEWLIMKGEEMAWKSLYHGAEALGALARGDVAGFTAHTVSALEYAAKAAAFGVAAAAISSSSSSSDDEDYDYDDEDVSTTEDTASDSDDDSPTIYVSTDDNAMARAMVNLLEQELNDEYNVSIIGKKK
jgi:TP901 family phage tail tape measure protein